MRKVNPYVEIMIKNKESMEWKWVKISENSAYISHEDGTKHYTIDARPFVSLLQKYESTIEKYMRNTLNKDVMSYIKYHYENKVVEFSFEYNNSDILELAYNMHSEFKAVIENNQQDYIVIEKEICDDIVALPPNTKIVLDAYYEKYGIVAKRNKDFLTRFIIKNLSQNYKVQKRRPLFKRAYYTILKGE